MPVGNSMPQKNEYLVGKWLADREWLAVIEKYTKIFKYFKKFDIANLSNNPIEKLHSKCTFGTEIKLIKEKLFLQRTWILINQFV